MNAKQKLTKALPILLVVSALTLTSTDFAIEEFSYSKNVELKSLKKIQADIHMNAGTLNLSTHSSSFAGFKSTYTKENWKADINLDPKGDRLSIYQPEEENYNMKDKDRNDWVLKLPENLAMELNLKMGAGKGIIDLSGSKVTKMNLDAGAGEFDLKLANTSLSNLNVNAGVGALTIDMSGKQGTNLKADINGGIGSIELVLPRNTGVRVKVNGLGSIEKNDLKKKNGYYINELYGKTSNNIEVSVKGGLGSIELRLK